MKNETITKKNENTVEFELSETLAKYSHGEV